MDNDRNKPEKGRVLVVDDLPDVQATLLGLLMDKGYDAKSASNKFEALKILSMEQFDIAILDIRLDETDEDNKDGLLLMHEIRRLYPNIATIILTGHADVKVVREALQPDPDGISPAFGFIEKSEIDEIPNCVDRAYAFVQRKTTSPIEDIIKQGENEKIEFKSSVRWNYKVKAATKDVQEAIAVAITGMLNNNGGTIIIGVTDDGNIVGIEKDIETLNKRSHDGFELFLRDVIRTYLGVEYGTLLSVQFEMVQGKTLCLVNIQKSPEPVFFNSGKDHQFWVRMGNSTRSLDVRATSKYIVSHWKKQE